MERLSLSRLAAGNDVFISQGVGDAGARRAILKDARGIAAFALPLALYVYSMQPTIGYWDVGEMQTVPYLLGIPHPTGFPAFVLLGFLFSHLFVLGSVAWRMTVFCALAMSLAAYFVFAIVRDEGGDENIALGCALLFAFGEAVWTRGTRTEVHALAMCFFAMSLFCALRWSRERDEKWLYIGAAVWGLALSTHPLTAFLGLGLFVLALQQWATIDARVLLRACAITLAIVCAFYAYFPIRSAALSATRADPTLRLGIPAGRPFFDYDHPASFSGFVALVTGSEFPVGQGFGDMFYPQTYVEKGYRYTDALQRNLTWLGALLAAGGLLAFFRIAPWRACAVVLSCFPLVGFGLAYPPESDVTRYFLPSLFAATILIGIACALFVKRVSNARVGALVVVFGLSAFELAAHASLLDQRFDPGATNFIARVKASTPSNAVIISPWPYATPLAYADYVEHDLGDRIIETAWLSDDVGYFARWIKDRPLAAVYLGGDPPPGFYLYRASAGDPPVYRVLRTP